MLYLQLIRHIFKWYIIEVDSSISQRVYYKHNSERSLSSVGWEVVWEVQGMVVHISRPIGYDIRTIHAK